MKTDAGKPASESRRIRKPLMEKKRRARINDSLETLKHILLESKTALKGQKNGQRTAKLEKADILEMTVRYLQQLHGAAKENVPVCQNRKEPVAIRPADSSCDNSIRRSGGLTLLAGEIVYFVPGNVQAVRNVAENNGECSSSVWRPW